MNRMKRVKRVKRKLKKKKKKKRKIKAKIAASRIRLIKQKNQQIKHLSFVVNYKILHARYYIY
jgi:hypothetical protein